MVGIALIVVTCIVMIMGVILKSKNKGKDHIIRNRILRAGCGVFILAWAAAALCAYFDATSPWIATTVFLGVWIGTIGAVVSVVMLMILNIKGASDDDA